jgi:hypothetical protein
MSRVTACALTLASLAALAPAQDQQALINLMEQSFTTAGPNRVYDFLAIARMQGLIRNVDEAAVAKELYAAFSDPAGIAAGHARTIVRSAEGGVGPAGGVDLESNDTVGFAETLDLSTGTCTVAGSTGTGDLRDVYTFTLAGETEVTISATGTATPSTVNLFDDVGRLVVVGLSPATGRREIRKICLPAGTYFVNVVGVSYTMTVTATAATCPVLVAGANADTVNPAGAVGEQFDVRSWKVIVPAGHADVQLSVASTATAPTDHNLIFNLGRANAGRVHFCDNVLPAPAHANDPEMKAGLPAGTYYVYIQNSVTAVTTAIPYTLTMSQTSITPRALCGSTNYTFSNSGHRDLFSFTTSGNERISVQTLVGTAPPTAGDSYLELFDANMGLILHNDDGCPAGTGCGFFSYFDCTLPAGTYYMTFRGFSAAGAAGEFGDYAVTGTCAQAATLVPLDAVRTGPTTIAAGTHTAWIYRACTDSPVQVAHTNNCHIIGTDGLLRASYQQLVAPGSTVLSGTSVRANEALILNQRTTSGSASTTNNIYLSGKLGIELSPVSAVGVYSLRSQDKVGRLQALFLSVGTGPQVPIAPFGGLLCLDLGTVVFVGFNPGTTANFTWPLPDLRPFIPPASVPGVRFQALSLDTSFNGHFTNIAQ